MLDKKIQVVGPLGIVVRIAIHMIYMRYPLFFEMLVHTLTDPDQAIFIPTGKPQHFELLPGCHQVGQQFGVGKSPEFIGIGSRRKSANRCEGIDMVKADVQGLATAHG